MRDGDVVILDKGFNNSSEVELIEFGRYFSIVSDGKTTWEAMTYRLSEKQASNENTVFSTSDR